MKKWLRKQLKKKSRIYIMPTRMGGYLNGLIFLMFLLSVGYSNNLLLIFTLFLFGLNLIWVIQTHYHLHALKLENVTILDTHAGENALVKVHWKKTPEGPHKWELKLLSEAQDIEVSRLEDLSMESTGQILMNKRGVWDFDSLIVRTEMPFGLYKSWIYLPIKARAWVYPAKLKDVPAVITRPSNRDGDYSTLHKGPHDVWNLGPYQGEESRKISWKHYARTGELVVKEGEELTNQSVHFEFISHPDKEKHLSKLASQMIYCARNETSFSFYTQTKRLEAQHTEKHLKDCLRELAQC